MRTLLAYKHIDWVPFGDGEYYNLYELTVLETSWFGLRKKKKIYRHKINMFLSLKECEQHWDKLIADKTHIPLA